MPAMNEFDESIALVPAARTNDGRADPRRESTHRHVRRLDAALLLKPC
jgi:hypothetical protein